MDGPAFMRLNQHKIIVFFALVLIGGLGTLHAQTVNPNSSTAFPILSTGFGARAVGMGESFTAVADDFSAVHYNPAGLAQIENPQLALMHNSYLEGGYYETIGFVMPFIGLGTVGLDVNYLNYGDIDLRDFSGNLLGSYSPFDISIGGAFGFSLVPHISLGLRSQWIRQEINGVVHTGMLWSSGFLYKPLANLSLGLALKNLGVETGGFNLPIELWLGSAYRLSLAPKDQHLLTIALDGDIAFQSVSRINAGFEYAFQNNYFVRAGYGYRLEDQGLDWINGLSCGAGVKLDRFQLDYALSFLGDLGKVHRVSLSLWLPSAQQPEAARAAAASAKASAAAAAAAQTSAVPVVVPAATAVVSAAVTVIQTVSAAPITVYVPFQTTPVAPVTQQAVTGAVTGEQPVEVKFQVAADENLTPQQYFDKAEERARLGLTEEAVDLYLKATEKDPNFEKAWVKLGKLYFDKSLETYRKALEANPNNERLRKWLDHYKK
jgi:tetratricopeptide (TPR) repeat protein